MDHAGEELERGAKLLRRPVARADGQARKVSIMQSRILLRGYAREGEMPPSLATHPQNQQPKSTTKPKPTTKPRSFTQRTGHTLATRRVAAAALGTWLGLKPSRLGFLMLTSHRS